MQAVFSRFFVECAAIAEPATGRGAMQGVSFIQRLNTKGGVVPALPCDAASKGQRRQVAYEADYVFYGS